MTGHNPGKPINRIIFFVFFAAWSLIMASCNPPLTPNIDPPSMELGPAPDDLITVTPPLLEEFMLEPVEDLDSVELLDLADPLEEDFTSNTFSLPTLCLIGPGTNYTVAFSVLDGDDVTLLGINARRDWILIEKIREESGLSCWVPEAALPELTVDQKAALPFVESPSSCTLSLLFERERIYQVLDEMNSEGEEPMDPLPISNYESCETLIQYLPDITVDFEFPDWLWVWPLQTANCRTGDTPQHQNVGTLFPNQPYEVLSMNLELTHVRVNIPSINVRCFVPLSLLVPGFGQWVIDRDELTNLVATFDPDGVPQTTAPDGSSSGDSDSSGDGDQPESSDPPSPTNTPCPVTAFPPCS